MKKTIFKTLSLCFLAGTLVFTSCNKKDEEIDMDTNTTVDNANAQSVFDDALKLSEDVLTANSAAKIAAGGKNIGCATVDSVKLGTNHIAFTITFDALCTGYDGRIRSGQLKVDLNGASFNTPGAVVTIKSSNYTVSGVKMEGKKTITCVAPGKHNIIVSDEAGSGFAVITYLNVNNHTAKWRTKRTRTLVGGSGTTTIADNVYDISTTAEGNPAAEGYNREGRHYVVNIKSPVRVDFTCFANNTARYPTQGVLELIPDGKIARSIDYGSGTCDNAVTITVGKKSFDFNLSY